jgi:membrane associated rhomboid family serine protease
MHQDQQMSETDRRVVRFRKNQALYLGAFVLFVLFYVLGRFAADLPSVDLLIAIGGFTPAVLLVWAFLRHIRRATDLQVRLLLKTLSASFVVVFAAAIIYAFLEGLGVPRPPSVLWASLLVISWTASLAISAGRYE